MWLIPENDPAQALRVRRFFIGVASYAMWIVLIFICHFLGYMRLSKSGTGLLFGMVILILAGFYVVFRNGWNKKFSDPSLTFAQMTPGILGAMITIYYTDEVRAVMLLIYVVTILFGVLRFNIKQFLIFTIFSLAGYGLVIILLYKYHPETVNMRIEILQFVVFAAVLIWFSMIGSYISSLRNRLSAANNKLSNALTTIETLAIHDDLTQAFNRRQMFVELRRCKSMADRSGTALSIAIFDLDHFKQVNDSFGHLMGDNVLKRLIREIGHELRESDSIARYGGEEFLVIMPDTDTEGAADCARRILGSAGRMSWPGFPESFRITISIGVTTYRPVESIDSLIIRADTALYRAKSNGRNRVEVQLGRPVFDIDN